MQYLGGKSRDAKRLAAAVNAYRKPGQIVWDPFCGGLSMAAALSDAGPVVASDIHRPLISLYRAVRSGWDPPSSVSEDEYRAAKDLPDSDPLKAFCGFGCSFAGMWFQTCAPSRKAPNGRVITYASSARASLLKQAPRPAYVGWFDFLDSEPGPIDWIFYLDPPYVGTIGYAGTPPFDHDRFYRLCEQWARHTLVYVSEYACPVGRVVWEAQPSGRARLNMGAVERLFLV